MKLTRHLALLVSLSVTACGGGGGSGGGATTPPPPPPPPSGMTGQVKFGNASGLAWSTASRSGTTDALGTFSYAAGETVELSIGGVVIGSAQAGDVITPHDLVPGGSADDESVLNIARFLLLLDQNEDPSDGIAISAGVQQAAANWTQVDFETDDLGAELVTIISDVASVDGRVATLPDAVAARDEIASNAYCAMSGFFYGSMTGDISSNLALNMNPASGLVRAFFSGSRIDYRSTIPVALDATRNFVADADGGANDSFEGRFDTYDNISGVYTIGDSTGTFSITRRIPDPTVSYRFTGRFYRQVVGSLLDGPLVINVDSMGTVLVDSRDFNFGRDFRAAGTFIDGEMSYDYGDGQNHTGTPDENLYIVGSGAQGNGVQRPWFAQGCKLN